MSTRLIVLLTCIILYCSNGGCSNPMGVVPTPREDEEAELMALCLSGDLFAPESLYMSVRDDLAAIRAKYGDAYQPISEITFRPPWIAGRFRLSLDQSAALKVADGDYHAWDELNERYGLIEVHYSPRFPEYPLLDLVFEPRWHSKRLAETYRSLPGISYTYAGSVYGAGSTIYPRQAGHEISYLFYRGWGDCPSGCTVKEYWYFVFSNGEPFLAGYLSPHQKGEDADWWPEALKNIALYRTW